MFGLHVLKFYQHCHQHVLHLVGIKLTLRTHNIGHCRKQSYWYWL